MRLIYILSFILLSSFALNAQNITGIWRGTFEQNSLDPVYGKFNSSTYKYEVQINDKKDGAVEGVTYSYLTTVFYGKASLKGRWNKNTKTLTIKETILVDMKASGKTDPCLMTCYLDYKKNGKVETLIGTFSSVKTKDKSDCGGGIVYLEKAEESDFEREDFLRPIAKTNVPRKLPSGKNFEAERLAEQNKLNAVKKPLTPANPNSTTTLKNVTKTNTTKPLVKTNSITKPIAKVPNKSSVTHKKIVRPNAKNNVVKNEVTPKIDSVVSKVEPPKEPIIELPKTKKIAPPTDDVLTERENKFVEKVLVDNKDVTIEFYDNGEIDNDTISVYKDNKLIVNHGRLSTVPIVVKLKFDEVNTFYELITVAENLGDIPPNTALMVINYGRKRKEVFLTSDEQKNAKVIIEYNGK